MITVERIQEIRLALPYYIGDAAHTFQRYDTADPDSKPMLVKSTPPELVGEVLTFQDYHRMLRELIEPLKETAGLNESATAMLKRARGVMTKRTAQMGWGEYCELIKGVLEIVEAMASGEPQKKLFAKSSEQLERENEELRQRIADFEANTKKGKEKGN